MKSTHINRRSFVSHGIAGTALSMTPLLANSKEEETKKIRVGIIGCGSVSHQYLPHLSKCKFAEVVSACDIIPERAEKQAKKFKIPNSYSHIDKMLAGAEFDLLVNTTDMQEHEHLNFQAIEAGKHVWSEKPMANTLLAGQKLLALAKKKGVKLWGAPTVVMSPQFAFMAQTINEGKLGRIAAAHADYGHTGPNWSAFFYEKGGGSLPDLAVYNLTSLTGLLGPAKSLTAMTSIVTPKRKTQNKGEIKVEAEDNAMVLMDHGNGIISHVQSGFNYCNPHGHEGSKEQRHTISVVGSNGYIGMVGYDWEPLGVDFSTHDQPKFKRYSTEKKDYVWQMGASLACESLATERELLITPEHALHVLEVIQATRESQETGRRIALTSTFRWPVVKG
jgi:predicted dehydrogenase